MVRLAGRHMLPYCPWWCHSTRRHRLRCVAVPKGLRGCLLPLPGRASQTAGTSWAASACPWGSGVARWPSLVVLPTYQHELDQIGRAMGFRGCLPPLPGRAPQAPSTSWAASACPWGSGVACWPSLVVLPTCQHELGQIGCAHGVPGSFAGLLGGTPTRGTVSALTPRASRGDAPGQLGTNRRQNQHHHGASSACMIPHHAPHRDRGEPGWGGVS